MSEKIYQAAVRYINMGWSVIPVRTDGSKAPALPKEEDSPNYNPKTFRTRYATEKELQNWFVKQKNYIGIVTGRLSNLGVVDVDSRELPEFLKRIKSSIVVQTPHGWHLYFKHTEGIGNGVKKIHPDVDFRSEGTFVVAPPSPGYFFSRGWVSLTQLRDFPSDLLPKEKTEIKRNGSGWVAEALNGLQEGNRDDTLFKVACRLNRDGYTSNDMFTLLTPHAESSNFTLDSLKRIIDHVITDYSNGNDTSDSDDSLSSFLSDIKPINWICSPIIGQGTLGFIAGLPETLKTWVCMDLAIAVASGKDWLGKFPVNQGRVLFIDQERYKGEVQRRLKLLLKGRGLNANEIEGKLIVKSQTTTRLDLDESFNAFRKRLSDITPSLIIVDSFATFHTKEENNRRDIQIVLERLKQLRTEFGCTIIMIDHENKSVFDKEDAGQLPTAFKMVGSVGKPAAAETVFTVRKTSENEVVIYHTKSTIAPTIEPIKVKLIDVNEGVQFICG